ncbi:hypothetical protein [Salegentibacter sp. F14]
MKNFKLFLGGFAIFAMLFTSCSKEETPVIDNGSEKAVLSFGTLLNDLVTTSRQQADLGIPTCVDDTPAYVEVILTGDQNIGTEEDPLVIDVNPTPIQEDGQDVWFTQESGDLELTPGSYTLTYFAVFNEGGDMIWLAPTTDGDLADFVDNALPLDINLGAGVKKYVDVEVLCFDDRMVNEYGYLFFDIIGKQAIEFCIFGNFCPPSGRHYPAAFSVDVWVWEDGEKGTQLYDDLGNSVELNGDGDWAGTPLCMALPDTSGDDEYYYEITLLSSDAYGNVEEEIIRVGSISDQEVKSFFDGEDNLDYWHFREGCETGDEPPIFQDPREDAKHYKACLYPENGSEVFGFAYFKLDDDMLRATVMATNLERGMDRPHPQHIHAGDDCEDSGGPVFALRKQNGEWPLAHSMWGSLNYNREFNLSADELTALGQLENRTINIHGMTVDGEYVPGIPVACGAIDLHEFD